MKKWKELFHSFFSKRDVLQGKSILVVDDGEMERKLYSRALESAGCRVQTAKDAAAALDAVKAGSFDLVLLDYNLPDRNGIEICRELKDSKTTRNIPVIFLTGSVRPEGVISCYEAGADYYLNKPISAVTLIKQVQLTLQA